MGQICEFPRKLIAGGPSVRSDVKSVNALGHSNQIVKALLVVLPVVVALIEIEVLG